MDLKKIIIDKIISEGPITFAKFMAMALYYPELGYYTRKDIKIGTAGDFYTSPHVHPAFGQMLARQFYEMWELLGKPVRWHLVECGAGKGLLARDILSCLSKNYNEAMDGLTYYIVEISPYLTGQQKKLLENLNLAPGKVSWVKDLSDISEKLVGCIFSNELVDSFPVHRVRKINDGLREIYVNYRYCKFIEEERELSTPLISSYFEEEGILLEPGQLAEVNLRARNWLNALTNVLQKGFLLTIDYGDRARELYSPLRPDGTLRCFYSHKLTNSPYLNIGRQDITASVNFSALIRWGKESGLLTLGLVSQAKFLLNLGIIDIIPPSPDYYFNEDKLKATLAIKKLIMSEGMGNVFKVLIQYKGFSGVPRLRGLNYIDSRQ